MSANTSPKLELLLILEQKFKHYKKFEITQV
jgi:hypothetical protein